MPAKKAADENEVVPVQGAEPTISESEAKEADAAEREARAARARREDTTAVGSLSVGGSRAVAKDEEKPTDKVTGRRPIIDPGTQQLVGYELETVTRAEADAGLRPKYQS